MADLAKPTTPSKVTFNPLIAIPGFLGGLVNGKTLGNYISAFYAFFSGIIGILAAVMVAYGGYQWLTAGGRAGQVQQAKTTIYSALTAIVITFGAYLLLLTINPELVKIKDLTSLVTQIQSVPLSEPQLYSEALVNNTGAQTLMSQYNGQSCPTDTATLKAGFPVFLTAYYRPAWGFTGGFGSFACNLAMQCSCVTDASATQCGPVRGYNKPWPPCDLTKVNQTSYCNKTSAPPVTPVGLYESGSQKTAAVNRSCFGRGTTFTVKSKNGSTVPAVVTAATWIAQDTGDAIRGSHIDMFMGTGGQGSPAYKTALSLTGEAVLTVKHYCPPNGGKCVDL